MTAKKKSAPPVSDEFLEMIAARFRVLGEPSRLRLLNTLRAGEMSVSQLVEETGSTQSNVSRHLQTLAEAGLVRRRKDGVAVYYSIADAQVFDLCEHVCGSVERRLRQQAEVASQFGQEIANRSPRAGQG